MQAPRQLSQQEKKVLVAATTIVEPKFPMHYPPNVGMRRLHCALETPSKSLALSKFDSWAVQIENSKHVERHGSKDLLPTNSWSKKFHAPRSRSGRIDKQSATKPKVPILHANDTCHDVTAALPCRISLAAAA